MIDYNKREIYYSIEYDKFQQFYITVLRVSDNNN